MFSACTGEKIRTDTNKDCGFAEPPPHCMKTGEALWAWTALTESTQQR